MDNDDAMGHAGQPFDEIVVEACSPALAGQDFSYAEGVCRH